MIDSPQRKAPGTFVAIFLLLIVGLAPLVEIANGIAPPLLPASARSRLLEVLVGSLCLVFVILSLTHSWQPYFKRTWQRTPFPFIVLLFLWSGFCFFRSPYPEFAFAEWQRVVLCLGVYVIAAFALKEREIRKLISGLAVLGVVMAMDGLLQFGVTRASGGDGGFDRIIGLFGDSENLGSFLMIMLPLSLQQALDKSNAEALRYGFQAAALIILITLAVNCTRSAWIGEIVALLIIGVLTIRERRLVIRRQHWILVSATATAVIAALVIAGSHTMVMNRARSLTRVSHLASFTDRQRKSEAALHMTAARPWVGWGLGTWGVTQRHWTGEGDTPSQVFARHDLWSRGGDQQSLAHNFYAQWAAETGGIGLGLYSAVIVSFFAFSFRQLPKVRSSQRRGILISCIAAAAGACLDALTSPAYNFPGVSGLLWLCMGIGTAAAEGTKIMSNTGSMR